MAPGGVRVHSNAVAPVVHRSALRKPTHAELGRGVWTECFQAFPPCLQQKGKKIEGNDTPFLPAIELAPTIRPPRPWASIRVAACL